jgi:hypothetical protein
MTPTKALDAHGEAGAARESVLFIGAQFSNLYTAVDMPTGAA